MIGVLATAVRKEVFAYLKAAAIAQDSRYLKGICGAILLVTHDAPCLEKQSIGIK